MSLAEHRDDPWSTPITNILQKDRVLWEQYVREFMLYGMWRQDLGTTPVAFHKEKMGRQFYCFTGNYRYWVWEYSKRRGPADHLYTEKVWRVYVNNHRGVGFEVNPKYTPEQAMAAWQDYTSYVGYENISNSSDVIGV